MYYIIFGYLVRKVLIQDGGMKEYVKNLIIKAYENI